MKRPLLLAVSLFLAATPCLAGAPVTLHPTVEVNSGAIRLSDVFQGVPTDIDRDIAVAPSPGKSVTYDYRVLAKLAEDYRLGWQPMSMVDKSVITRAATTITMDMIHAAVMAKLEETKSLEKKTIELTFDNRNLSVNLPANQPPDFKLANFTYDEQGRRFRADLVAQTDGQPVNHTISGRVLVKRSVPVLSRRLEAGTTISASDINWITVNEDQLGVDVITDASPLVGQELRHDQAEGEFLRSRDVIPQRLVTRGSLVTLKIETPVMLITTQGKALQDGGKGDVVRITNTQTNRVIEGTVEASGVVRIGAGALQKVASSKASR